MMVLELLPFIGDSICSANLGVDKSCGRFIMEVTALGQARGVPGELDPFGKDLPFVFVGYWK
ncbi:unnamed protein product [Ilex paraguariensis]|uniref:Uncharacterized protein n=1 Tax=Ilex paraguariensis TaxID=185542 RepID=A0ABC8SG47_9AQUA